MNPPGAVALLLTAAFAVGLVYVLMNVLIRVLLSLTRRDRR